MSETKTFKDYYLCLIIDTGVNWNTFFGRTNKMGEILIVKYTNFEIWIDDIIKLVIDVADNYFK